MKATNAIRTSALDVVHVRHGRSVRALDMDALTVPAGTALAVTGPSGCGKSTLLGLLAGLAVPTTGSVTVGEHEVSTMNERERIRWRRSTVGMVYQADNLLPHLSVEENVALSLAIVRRDRSGRQEPDPQQVVHLLDRLGLADLRRRLPDQLSGGQRQRVAVARAVVHRPDLILADEPTGALDSDSAGRVLALLLEAQRDLGATLVLVTHDAHVAAATDVTVRLARPVQPSAGSEVLGHVG